MDEAIRPGEIRASVDPATAPGDSSIVFIGRAQTPWRDRHGMPKNLRQARERGGGAKIEIDAPWRPGLKDLSAGAHVVLFSWMDRARRDLVVQSPRHANGPKGVFSLRSPVRPNPIGLHIVRLIACDAETGMLTIDALDCLDGTPIIDVKPWLSSVDVPPEIEE